MYSDKKTKQKKAKQHNTPLPQKKRKEEEEENPPKTKEAIEYQIGIISLWIYL